MQETGRVLLSGTAVFCLCEHTLVDRKNAAPEQPESEHEVICAAGQGLLNLFTPKLGCIFPEELTCLM